MTGLLRNRVRSRALLASTALGAVLAGLGTAPALAVTDQEAENFRRDIEQFLADPGYPGWAFESGAVTAEVADDGYNFVIPDLVVIYSDPEAASYGSPESIAIEVDNLNIRLVPDAVDSALMAVDISFGDGSLLGGGGAVEFRVHPTDDTDDGAVIEIGKHEISGHWSSDISYFTGITMALQDIVATPIGGGNEQLTIGLISGSSIMSEAEPGLWDGTGETRFENVVMQDGDEVPFRLGSFTLTQTVAGFAFEEYMEWAQSNPIMMGEQPDYASEEEAAEDIRQVMLDFPTLMDDFSIGWSITDLEAGDPSERVVVPSHEFVVFASGLAGDRSDWNLRLFLQGMTMPDREVPPQFVPTVVDIDVGITDLPTGLGWQAMEDAIGTTDLRDLESVGPMLGQQIIQLALESETGLDLGGEIGWETGNIAFTGTIQADPTSPMMASGGLNVVFNQMQDFIREVENTMGAETAGPLTMIQALGQQEDDATVYDFQISGSNILMNGQDMQPLMMMLGQ